MNRKASALNVMSLRIGELTRAFDELKDIVQTFDTVPREDDLRQLRWMARDIEQWQKRLEAEQAEMRAA